MCVTIPAPKAPVRTFMSSPRQLGRLNRLYQEQLELNTKLTRAIEQTIGWVESTGGCDESIRMLRVALGEVKS
ncbi:hypothetical protein EXT48_08310 [Pseudoalteromonas sp. CO348]|uniref:hypothetical protein n=1 Tax=Pseudoalteromonas sp. CO348 TaxID=1777271 RepID=UPI00102344FB|nr:hypothetical protein [Pseudoalteromonas sp. CO348]RZG05527.1 hypothetical protein EXT48_08310 [Pseudoalteromonas sp. CO348]